MFGKILRYKLCSGVATSYVVIDYAVVWQHTMSEDIAVYAVYSAE